MKVEGLVGRGPALLKDLILLVTAGFFVYSSIVSFFNCIFACINGER